jgi:hypothetical protein
MPARHTYLRRETGWDRRWLRRSSEDCRREASQRFPVLCARVGISEDTGFPVAGETHGSLTRRSVSLMMRLGRDILAVNEAVDRLVAGLEGELRERVVVLGVVGEVVVGVVVGVRSGGEDAAVLGEPEGRRFSDLLGSRPRTPGHDSVVLRGGWWSWIGASAIHGGGKAPGGDGNPQRPSFQSITNTNTITTTTTTKFSKQTWRPQWVGHRRPSSRQRLTKMCPLQ